MLAMVRWPEIQKRAQAEIDSVVGRGRFPTYADQPNLPYVTAVVKETCRYAFLDDSPALICIVLLTVAIGGGLLHPFQFLMLRHRWVSLPA